MRKPNNDLLAQIEFVCGSSGTGKSAEIKKRLADPREKEVIVWDAKNEYGDLPGFTSTHDPREFLKLVQRGGRIAFAAPPSQFEFYCKVVWARGGCWNIVEELAAVTGTAKACGAWHLIVSQGRGYGIRTTGIAQRAAEVDKTLIGNATLIHVRRLTRVDDRIAMAKELDVPLSDLTALPNYQFIERDMGTGKLRYSQQGKGVAAPPKIARKRG